MADVDPLPISDAQRLSAMVWGGELRKAEDELRRLPADSPRVALLFGQAAFVEAVLTGDGDVAGEAVLRLEACERACLAVESPTWAEWTRSWWAKAPPDAARDEARAARGIGTLLLAVSHTMKQQWIKSPLALRRSIGAFAGLPEEAAPAVRPQRLLGVGTSNLLLALLPAPLARLLTLAGFGRPSEARGLEMLREAAEGGGGDDGVYDGGARWLARVALLLFGNTAATMRGGGDAAAEKARALASLAALEAELPGSLLFEWVGALTLRRVGELPAAARRLEAVLERSEALLPGCPLYRVRFNAAQLRFATLQYAAAADGLGPLVGEASRYTAKAMCLWHRAAALSQLGRCDEARDDLRAIAVTAKATGGRLDAQLAQRAAGWLLRADADLALGALEVSYQMGYHRQRRAQPGGGGENGGGEGGGETGGGGDASATLAELEAHAAPSLAAAAASASAEVRAAALLLGGALAAAAGRHAEAREGLGRAREAAATAEYLETAPDRWVAAFASLELANVCVDTADFDGASAALRAASQVADKSFSFHSWLGSAVREARARLKRARESAGAAPAADADEVEEAAADEAPEVAALRAAMEKEEEEAKAAGA